MSPKRIIIAIAIAALILLPFAFLKAKEWSQIDRCLDAGGRWNYQTRQCEFSAPEENPKALP